MAQSKYYTMKHKEDGSWELINPEGNEFFSLGVNCVYFPDNLNINVQQKYGNDNRWFERYADKKLAQIEDLGFNTLAAWHEPYYWKTAFPKTVELSLSKHASKVNKKSRESLR